MEKMVADEKRPREERISVFYHLKMGRFLDLGIFCRIL